MKTNFTAAQYGLLGLQRGRLQMRQAASRIASADAMRDDRAQPLAESLLALHAGSRQVRISARVIEAEQRLLGTLLDEFG